MQIIGRLAAGVWLLIVCGQALAFLTRYGLIPLPEAVGRLDFSTQYTPVLLLVIAGTLLAPRPAKPGAPVERGTS